MYFNSSTYSVHCILPYASLVITVKYDDTAWEHVNVLRIVRELAGIPINHPISTNGIQAVNPESLGTCRVVLNDSGLA